MKKYVRLADKSSAPTHIANSPNSTYCQFEKTTRRRLIGLMEILAGADLCKNCLSLSRGRKRKFVAPKPSKEPNFGAVRPGALVRPWAPDSALPPWDEDSLPTQDLGAQLDAEYRAIMAADALT